ncbi:MAG: hypothetical protein AAF500_09605 [Myxococcota bacterium]
MSAESPEERLRAFLARTKPPTGGVDLNDVVRETAPLLPLLKELPPSERAEGDYESFQFRECLTVLTLLGRRLALLDLTPTVAVQIVHLALRSAEEDGAKPPRRFSERAAAAMIEGFVMGREEHVLAQHEREATRHLHPIRIDDDVFALVLTGSHEPEVLREQVDALGRAMLEAGSEIAIVDVSQLGEANRERVVALSSAGEVVRMLGGVCLFSGVDDRWQAAMREAAIDLDLVEVHRDFSVALDRARGLAAGPSSTRRSRWQTLLARLTR